MTISRLGTFGTAFLILLAGPAHAAGVTAAAAPDKVSPYGAYMPQAATLESVSTKPFDRVRDELNAHERAFRKCAVVLNKRQSVKLGSNDGYTGIVEVVVAVDAGGKAERSRPLSREVAINRVNECLLREARELTYGTLEGPVEVALSVDLACQTEISGDVSEVRCVATDFSVEKYRASAPSG